MSENAAGGATSDRAATRFDACANTVCVSGSAADPGQFVAVPAPIAPSRPLTLPRIAGVNGELPTLYRFNTSSACARRSGVKSIRSSGTLREVRAQRGGLGGTARAGVVFS